MLLSYSPESQSSSDRPAATAGAPDSTLPQSRTAEAGATWRLHRTPREILQQEFPYVDGDFLAGILKEVHGDIEMARQLMSG